VLFGLIPFPAVSSLLSKEGQEGFALIGISSLRNCCMGSVLGVLLTAGLDKYPRTRDGEIPAPCRFV
jgi:hypothetical protein